MTISNIQLKLLNIQSEGVQMYKGVLFSPQFMMLYASKISVLQHTIKVVAYTTK